MVTGAVDPAVVDDAALVEGELVVAFVVVWTVVSGVITGVIDSAVVEGGFIVISLQSSNCNILGFAATVAFFANEAQFTQI